MILVDANVLMYAGGAEHPNRQPSLDFLRAVAAGQVEATIDAEVLQEILHRYRALNRWEDGRRVFDLARRIFPEVLAVTGEVMDRARQLMDADTGISARDALHASAAFCYGAEAVCSFDGDFDRIPGCRRITPAAARSGR